MMTEAIRLDIVIGIFWEIEIIMMINGNRLVHKWQEKTLLHQPFVCSAHNFTDCFQSGL